MSGPRGLLVTVAIIGLVACSTTRADDRVEADGELQLYPAGIIGAVGVRYHLDDRSALTFRAGYNSADRDDDGEHDDEDGGGPGVSVGYRRYLADDRQGWFLGGRVDLWWLDIDWVDNPGLPAETSGSSDTLVLQPTVEGGRRFHFGGGERWFVEPNLAFGWEINVDTDGEDVGEGAILLGGVSVGYRF